MATLGSCLLSHDIPYEGMAKDIVERRIAGQSWKQIGEDLNIGSPGAARHLFTKLTGITDYKIKGNDLLNLAKSSKIAGVPDIKTPGETFVAKKAATKAKIPDVTSSETPKWKNTAGDIKVDDIPSAKRIAIKNLNDSGLTYTQIRQQFPELSIEQIDRVVARHLILKHDGDAYSALQSKVNSLTLQKHVGDTVFDLVEKGVKKADISKGLQIPTRVIDDIVTANGKWSLPFNHKLASFVDEGDVELPDYSVKISNPDVGSHLEPGNVSFGYGTGRGSVDFDAFPKATPESLRAMRRQQWEVAFHSEDRHYPEFHTRSYTGSAYHEINSSLRGGRTHSSVKFMDRAMYEVTEDFSVTRGMGTEGFGLGYIGDDAVKQLVGKTIADKGFLSTSTNPIFGGGVRLNIEVPKGARGHWAKPISIHSSENEFIMARGTRMTILGVEKIGYTWHVRARVIV